ncbi:MAG: GGDEF domain-containing protein [Burkholderiales bacterium]|nr:GGDEF domain-containing protein [Burkholderiales bacterium]
MNWVLGTDPRMRGRTRLCLLASVLYLVWICLISSGIEAGLFISDHAAQWAIALNVLAMLIGYPLVRSGKSMHWADPALVLPQMLGAQALACFAYATAPDARGALMQWMCFIQVFGLFSLSPREVKLSGSGSILILVLMLFIASSIGLPSFNPGEQTLRVVMQGFVMGILCWVSYHYSLMRGRVRAQKQELTLTVKAVQDIIEHDALTGLYNRRHMQILLQAEMDRCHRSGHRFCIALVDLDHFKFINETFGPHIGDEVLKNFGRHTRMILRETDVIARWGGEEFLLIMPDTNPSERAKVGLERLRRSLLLQTMSNKAPDLRATFSAGIAVYHQGETMDQVLDRADRALYQAKDQGRSRTVLSADDVLLQSQAQSQAQRQP